MSSSDQESISRRSYPGHAETQMTVSSCNGNASTSSSSPSAGAVKVVALATVVSTTSSSTTATTTALPTGAPLPVPLSGSSSNGNNNNSSSVNKKHNLGYRLRRLLFPQLRSTTGTTLSKHKAGKDVENNENQVRSLW